VHRRELNERRALLKILGVCFLLLAAYIAYESALDLWSRRAPGHSIPGIVLTCVSTLVPYIHHSETSFGWYVPDKPLKAVEGCEFIHYLADENQWTDWGHELGILSRHKCLGITYLLRAEWGVFLRSVEGDEPLIRGETHPSSEPPANYCDFESSQGTPNDLLSR